jgi:hypothetical protein
MVAETEHRKNERMMARWTRNLGWFTFVLVVVGVITAAILYVTDQTSRLRDRAFVYFGDPPVTPYPTSDPILWGVGITVTNAGNMPARRLTIRYACPDVPFSDDVLDTFRLVTTQWKTAQIGSVIGPKQGATLQACEVPIDVINEAKNSLRRVFYLVEAKYLDGFDLSTPRVTRMSRVFGFDRFGGQNLGFTSSHNCSDDDCPK